MVARCGLSKSEALSLDIDEAAGFLDVLDDEEFKRAQLLAALHITVKKQGGESFTYKDFLPSYLRNEEEDESEAVMRAFAANVTRRFTK